MSLYTRGEPASNHQFRQNTERRAGQMIGVTSTPKLCRCVCCGKRRTEASGKHTADGGFVCGMCRSGNHGRD